MVAVPVVLVRSIGRVAIKPPGAVDNRGSWIGESGLGAVDVARQIEFVPESQVPPLTPSFVGPSPGRAGKVDGAGPLKTREIKLAEPALDPRSRRPPYR